MSSTDATFATSYIHEFPHPAFIVHYHPDTSQFKIEYVQEALDKQVSAIELDLRYRSSDKQVVCNHDSASAESPTLVEVFDLVLGVKGASQTLYDTGHQFFFVLEPKQDSDVLLDSVRKILEQYSGNWSTTA
jgi:glycerophosphoryl diester phosphodiesterase